MIIVTPRDSDSILPGAAGRRERVQSPTVVLLVGALVWSAAIFAVAMFAPLYQGESTEAGAGGAEITSHYSRTLVEENGNGVVIIVAIPMLLTIAVGMAFGLSGVSRAAGLAAWPVAGVAVVLNVASLLSVGIFFIPVTVCLVVACVVRQNHQRKAPVLHSTLGA